MACPAPALSAPEPEDDTGTRLAWESWHCLDLLAEVGEADTQNRHAWEILVRAHGFPAVLRAVARCYWLVAPRGRVTCDQTQAVLDGKLPRALQDRRSRKRSESLN
jgi:hypothetical protein